MTRGQDGLVGSLPAAKVNSAPNPPSEEPSTKRLVFYTASARSVNFLATIALTLVVSPLLLHALGTARYGSWALIAQLTGYYGLLDWGVRAAVGYFVAALIPKAKLLELNSIISTALAFLVAVAVVVVGLGIGLAVYLERVFNLAGSDPREVRRAFVVVTIAVACSLPFEAFAAVVNGCRRAYLTTGADTVTRVLSAVATVVWLLHGGGLVGLAVIQLLSRAVVWMVTVWNARRLLPTLKVTPQAIGREAARELAGYGARTFLINAAGLIIYRLDLVVVAAFLDLSLVTRYTIGQTLVDYASNAVLNVTQSFTPHFTHTHERDGLAAVRQMYLQGARISGAVGMLLSGGILVFGGPFIRLWLGDDLVSGPWLQRSDTILLILLLGQAPRFMQSISWQLCFGLRKVNFLTVIQLSEAGCNLALSLWWVRVWGAAGVALGSTVPLLVTNLFVMPWYVSRVLGMTAYSYIVTALAPGILVGAAVAVCGSLLTSVAAPTGWFVLVAEIAASTATGLLAGSSLVLAHDDRRDVRAYVNRAVAAWSRRGNGRPPAGNL
jgi:O-antigen/teichoic acid export membrane protein